MGVNSRVAEAFRLFRRVIYRPLLAPIARRVGVDSHLHDLYWRVFLAFSRAQTATVGNATATFRVHSRAEYWRTQDFIGERFILADFLDELSTGDVFYDVGANIGLYSCFAASQLSSGRIVAFEPHPQTADRLRTNLSLNGDQFKVYQYALSDREGTMNLAPPEGSDRPGTFSLYGGVDGAVPVEVVRGDDLRKRASLPVPTILKIDVEGAELDVIEGLSGTLSQKACRLVYVEVHPPVLKARNSSQGAVTERLREFGFSVSVMQTRNSQIFLKAER